MKIRAKATDSFNEMDSCCHKRVQVDSPSVECSRKRRREGTR